MSIKTTKDADIVYSDKDKLSDDEFEPKYVKHRISILIPEDVLNHYREMAKKEGIGYQTLINKVLRENMNANNSNLEERLKKLEQIVLQKGAS